MWSDYQREFGEKNRRNRRRSANDRGVSTKEADWWNEREGGVEEGRRPYTIARRSVKWSTLLERENNRGTKKEGSRWKERKGHPIYTKTNFTIKWKWLGDGGPFATTRTGSLRISGVSRSKCEGCLHCRGPSENPDPVDVE